MNRILIVATSEFLALVKTKFFIIGLLMMPVMVGVSIGFQVFAAKRVDREDRKFAVIDRTGAFYQGIAAAADEHNRKVGSGATATGPTFSPSEIDLGGRSIDAVKLDLSNQVKAKDLFAFVVIPAGVVDADAKAEPIEYYTETPSYETLPSWLDQKLGDAITGQRFAQASIDPKLVAKLTRPVELSKLGLVERAADGSVSHAKKVNDVATFLVPFGLMYLLFIAVMSSAPQLLNAVIEEKMSRISEVLVASVTPFQLMMGKLAGTAVVSVVLALFYLGGGTYALISTGQFDLINPALFAWFILFLLCAVLMFGSIFLAIGAASSDLKDAQGMMQPAMLIVLLPILIAPVIIRAPDSGLAIGASFFPTAAPFLMLIRLAMTPAPPLWQVLLSVVLMLGTACGLVWAAGRIFRVGLLMQGKGATLAEMIRWVKA
jgi:ABC-2 type transport system permease protein